MFVILNRLNIYRKRRYINPKWSSIQSHGSNLVNIHRCQMYFYRGSAASGISSAPPDLAIASMTFATESSAASPMW